MKILSQKVFNISDFAECGNSLGENYIINVPNNPEESVNLQPNIQVALSHSDLLGSTQKLEDKLDRILANQETIIQNQNAIVLQLVENTATKDNQLLIIQQLAKYEATLDTIGIKISKTSNSNSLFEKEKENINIVIEEIKTVDDLEKLEKMLQEEKIMKDFVDRLSVVCGQKGNGNGTNNCYILVDRIFSRKFMTLCSWAGGARDKKEKIPFKMYKNVINLFFQVIRLSDNSFTLKDCEEFFKNVIRNSTRRSQSNMTRNSAIKRRPKELFYTKDKGENQNKRKGIEEEKKEENVFDHIEINNKEEEKEEENIIDHTQINNKSDEEGEETDGNDGDAEEGII